MSVVLLVFLLATGFVALATEDFVRSELEKGWDVLKVRVLQAWQPGGRRRRLPRRRPAAAAPEPDGTSSI